MASALELEELARQAEAVRQPERYVPASGAVAPMVPVQGGPYGPEQGPPAPAPAQQVQVPTGVVARALGALSGTPVPATTNVVAPSEAPAGPPTGLPGAINRGLSVLGGLPVGEPPINPPEQPSPRPTPLPSGNAVLDERPSAATQAIVAARDADTAPTVEGQGNALTALGGAIARGTTDAAAVTDAEASRGAASTVLPASATPVTPPVTPATTQSGAPTAQPQEPVDLRKPIKAKGAAGGAQRPALSGARSRDELPDATEKAKISPTFLVELEKTNPGLHDGIVQAATAAGIGSWDYANMVYAMSKGDPNNNQGGRIGLAGLTQADIERYQKQRPELFRDAQGNPVDPRNPSTNLLVGALHYREMRDKYGARTPASVLGYIMGEDKVDPLSRLTPPEQQAMIPSQAQQQVQQAMHGPDAGAPHMTPVPMTITPSGTATPSQTMAVAVQAAKTGNAMPFISYAVNALPRGMGGNDGWRYLENNVTAAFMRSGNVEGAQRARELIFQMSHVGANQALMSAYKQMQLGDYDGAAKQLSLAYWAAPDGGLAQFTTGKDKDGNPVMFGQRYNDDTRRPVGPTFQVTPDKLITMMQQTRDPNQFAKLMQDNQKLHAEIADKYADTEYKKAHARYLENLRPSVERVAGVTAETGALKAAATLAGRGAGGAAKVDPRVAHIDQEVNKYLDKGKDPVTQAPVPYTPEEDLVADLSKNMRLNNDSMSTPAAVGFARDLVRNPTGGKYMVSPMTGAKTGWGAVVDRKTGAKVAELNSSAMQRFRPGSAPNPIPAAPGLARTPTSAGAGG